jgi:hypothetical protein
MSYTIELESTIANASSEVASHVGSQDRTESQKQASDQPSALELFSYGVCCAGQGLLGMMYFALVVFVPIAISQGVFSLP